MSYGQEKRKYKRIEKDFMVRLRTTSLADKKAGSTDWNMVAVRNLGVGGMLFYYNKSLELNLLLDLKINISKSTPTINCVGKIKRIEEPIPPSIFGIATEFTGIDEQEKEMINKVAEGISE
jgi:hypothetical protein